MVQYVLVDDMKKQEFEKRYQLPYGCWNTLIYSDIKLATMFLETMPSYKRPCYNIEKWDNGVFVEVVVNGRELV